MRKIHTTLVPLVITIFAIILLSTSSAIAKDNCAPLLENKCTECHNLNRVCEKLGKKNKKRWVRTIKRMVKRGAKLTKSEKKEILNCLVDQSPGTLQACK